jgi:hypothetical protein
MDVIGMYLGDVWIRDDNVREVSEGLDAVGKACRKN